MFLKYIENNPILSTIIIILICISLYLIFTSIFLKSITTSQNAPASTTSIISTPAKSTSNLNMINLNDIIMALAGAGINVKTQENFEDAIVYGSYDTIKQNFATFLNTYFPALDVNHMNQMLKNDYNINKTITEIISENSDKNFIAYINIILSESQSIQQISNSKDIILSGLIFIILMKLSNNNSNIDIYYLDDYNELKEFYIYFVPKTFDKNNLTNKNTSIPEIQDYNNLNRFDFFMPNQDIYKLSLNKVLNALFKNMIQKTERTENSTSRPMSSISDEEVTNTINIFKNNKEGLLQYQRFMILGPLIKLATSQNLTLTSKISIDFIDLFTTDKYFDESIKRYLPDREVVVIIIERMFNNIFNPLTYTRPNQATNTINFTYAHKLLANTTQTKILKVYSNSDKSGIVTIFDISYASFIEQTQSTIIIVPALVPNSEIGYIELTQPTSVDYIYIIEVEYVLRNTTSTSSGSFFPSSSIRTIGHRESTVIRPSITEDGITYVLSMIKIYKQRII